MIQSSEIKPMELEADTDSADDSIAYNLMKTRLSESEAEAEN